MTEAKMEMIAGYARAETNDAKKRAEETRTITFVASTHAVDRHGSVVNQKGWSLENFVRNPIIGYQHNVYGGDMCNAPDPDDVIGRGKNVRVVNDELVLDIVFDKNNPKAEKIFRKVQDGFLNAVSVGFASIPNEHGEESRMGDETRGENPDVEYFYGQELLEVSIVNIPSNPEALAKQRGLQLRKNTGYIQKQLGVNLKELEAMTVGEVLNKLENPTRKVSTITKDVISQTGDKAFEYIEKHDDTNEREVEEIAAAEKATDKEADSKESEVSEDASLSVEKARNQLYKQRLNFNLNNE